MKNNIITSITDSIKVKEKMLSALIPEIEHTAKTIIKAYKKKKKVLIFGNGGSAADSQHIAAELVGRFKKERQAWPAIALTTNTSILTALANDYSYDCIFERQIEALGNKGDIAIGISTSGKAPNVIAGFKKARKQGLTCIALTGQKGSNLKKLTDICLMAPAKDTPRIQEAHILIAHIICDLVEKDLTS
ncbi:MAG: D-sedoheptulose 7-phosphate isomerase [PVC group bacterium]|nr:D-sedoheptulose 7-phosphate isomerase [PVC group bacterium]